jgi:hypothetical protein
MKIRRNYRQIPGYSNYAINSRGEIYNVNTGNVISRSVNSKTHYLGTVTVTDDNGNRRSRSVISLATRAFPGMSENRLTSRISQTNT